MRATELDAGELTLELAGCEGDDAVWVNLYTQGESGAELVRQVEVKGKVRLELAPNVYVIDRADGALERPLLIDLASQRSAQESLTRGAGSGGTGGGGAFPPDPAFAVIRAEASLREFIIEKAPHLLLASAFKRNEPFLGTVEKDAQGRPKVDVTKDSRIIRGSNGAIVYTAAYGAHLIHGPIYAKWKSKEAEYAQRGISYWAFPTSAERDAEGPTGRCQFFKRLDSGVFEAAIYWSLDSGAHVVQNPFLTPYGLAKFSAGPLGFPRSDASTVEFNGGWTQTQSFQRGQVFQPHFLGPNEVYAVTGAMFPVWQGLDALDKVGMPTSNALTDGGADVQHFKQKLGWPGTLVLRAGKTYSFWGEIRDRWVGDRRSAYGWPTRSMERRGKYEEMEFENFYVQWNGGQPGTPGMEYIETPLQGVTTPKEPGLTDMVRVTTALGTYYERQTFGTFKDLFWPGNLGDQRLLLGNLPALVAPSSTNTALLDPGKLLGEAKFKSLFGEFSPTLYAVPIAKDGSKDVSRTHLGVGLVPKP